MCLSMHLLLKLQRVRKVSGAFDCLIVFAHAA